MKIYQFTPPPPLISKNKEATKAQAAPGSSFAEILSASAAKPDKNISVISLENSRASKLPPPADLGAAGLLLSGLAHDIKQASPEALNALHKLDGLVYVWQTT